MMGGSRGSLWRARGASAAVIGGENWPGACLFSDGYLLIVHMTRYAAFLREHYNGKY